MHGGAVVTGDIVEEVFAQTSFDHVVEFPDDGSENVRVNPFEHQRLEPGAYKRIRVQPHATLVLESGTYFVESMVVQPGASAVLDAASGPIRIYVRTSFTNIRSVLGC